MKRRSSPLILLALTLAACGGGAPRSAPLPVDVTWLLADLEGRPAERGGGNRPATLQFRAADGRVAGFGGCNSYGGTYRSAGDSLRLGPLMMTRMACDAGMTLEQRLTTTLERVRRFRVAGDTLLLLGDAGTLARFTRAP